ncbi:CAMK family protein kinase [Tritrichomonas foetus]|uniref:CAMK family protein kinase n=1 Tax=Tritrichomonas foetus TaxID=1144522 RepID=A0A1J4K477_9EUKA|nr:CAMK family protein kinase [Tritrichomonas foetus]|eukprot:OHT05995.1 CAMK family protein kinase [Tritrichomonas foetus]
MQNDFVNTCVSSMSSGKPIRFIHKEVFPPPNSHGKNFVSNKLGNSQKPKDVIAPNKIGPFLLKEQIGTGGFSVVKKAIHFETGKEYACKIIPKQMLTSPKLEKRFENEVRIMQKLKHPGIIILYAMFKDTLNYYLIMEYCPHGTLLNYISENGSVSENDAKYIFKQIVLSLKYIHSQSVIHRDIKPENILIDENKNIKIIDFGLAEFYFKENENELITSQSGSLIYMSPEWVSGQYNGVKNDIWALGIILYILFFKGIPWTKQNHKIVVKQISELTFFVSKSISEPARDLINSILTYEDKRLTLEQIENHEWLKNVDSVDYSKIEYEKEEMNILIEDGVDEFFDNRPPDNQELKILPKYAQYFTRKRRYASLKQSGVTTFTSNQKRPVVKSSSYLTTFHSPSFSHKLI